jgi:hypothetical protein
MSKKKNSIAWCQKSSRAAPQRAMSWGGGAGDATVMKARGGAVAAKYAGRQGRRGGRPAWGVSSCSDEAAKFDPLHITWGVSSTGVARGWGEIGGETTVPVFHDLVTWGLTWPVPWATFFSSTGKEGTFPAPRAVALVALGLAPPLPPCVAALEPAPSSPRPPLPPPRRRSTLSPPRSVTTAIL